MKALIQRVKRASVSVAGESIASIESGMLVLLGIERDDTEEDTRRLGERTLHLRIFPDLDGKMNRDVIESGGEILVVSQFTLVADTSRGRRPSYARAASPEKAEDLYRRYALELEQSGVIVKCGRFRAMMDVELVNDGPVTLWLETAVRKESKRGA